jgi:cell division protein FtsX
MGMIVADALRTQSTKAQAPSTTAPATDKITVSRVKNGKKVSTTVSTEEATQEVKDNQTTIQRLTQMLDCL